MSTEINREDIVDLRARVNVLEEKLAKVVVRMGVICSIIATAIPSAAAIAPSLMHH